jgi:two-component system, LuxR family, response regulator FixJ
MTHGHIYLIDNDRGRRDSLAATLQEQRYGLEVFDDAPTFLNRIDYERIPPSACVVTYLSLAPLSGVELLDVFRADRVTLPTILIGATSELALAVKAMRYGASYVLWRPFNATLLVDVVNSVLREWSDVAQSHAASDERDLQSLEDRFSSLSRRQRQVLRYVFEGNGNREIANALGISIKTVELHRACAMKKMRADSVIALVKMMADFRHASEQVT